ncbi:hypothetical protein CDAR_307531 [Caerostris darwini]|uniref:Uncharacterized protein n=1 Tax=Caerostris darwini TaxID=1538125 RepID=A0AAV4MCE3_9ARAC|nr:hypothetical protein CDAR_307531 [Caerostris darwini]
MNARCIPFRKNTEKFQFHSHEDRMEHAKEPPLQVSQKWAESLYKWAHKKTDISLDENYSQRHQFSNIAFTEIQVSTFCLLHTVEKKLFILKLHGIALYLKRGFFDVAGSIVLIFYLAEKSNKI